MFINEFEWPKRRECYEWTNLNYHWRIPLLIVSNWLAQFAIWSLSCWSRVAKDKFEFWYFTAIAFRTKLIARNVKLIGESLKLTGKSYINFDTVDFSERRREEVMFIFALSVHYLLPAFHNKYLCQDFVEPAWVQNHQGHVTEVYNAPEMVKCLENTLLFKPANAKVIQYVLHLRKMLFLINIPY